MDFLNFGILYIFDVGEDRHLKCATKMDYDNPHRGVGSVTCSSFTTLKPSKKLHECTMTTDSNLVIKHWKPQTS